MVERIHTQLMQLAADLRANKIALEKFIITKGLTKSPKEYSDAKNMPHVKVALELLAQGKVVRQGDFIPYIICEGDAPMAQRAYHPATVQAAGGALGIDLKWYLANQVLPPVARLCGPIEETDAGKIAHFLGLDPRQFYNFNSKDETAAANDDDEIAIIHQDDEEKFKSATPLVVKCPVCSCSYNFPGVFHPLEEKKDIVKAEDADDKKEDTLQLARAQKTTSGLKCPNVGCVGMVNGSDESVVFTSIVNRLIFDIRKAVLNYYNASYVCSDSSCGWKTRDVSISGSACLQKGCQGKMEREVSPSQLFTQLQYYKNLFDVERATDLIIAENKKRKEQNLPSIAFSPSESDKKIFELLFNRTLAILQSSAYYYLPPTIFQTKVNSNKDSSNVVKKKK